MFELNKNSLIKLSKLMAKYLDESEWTEIFVLCDSEDYPTKSFWNDVHFRNPDLFSSVLKAVKYLINLNSDNLSFILGLERFSNLLERDDSALYNELKVLVGDECSKNILSKPVNNINDNVLKALEDAELLILQKGPESALDRIHTAVHASLRLICENNDIAYNTTNSNINGLMSVINSHLKSVPAGDRNSQVFNMLRSANSILDVLNQLRNHNSMAHPAKSLLNEADARFAINLARSIMVYIDELFD